MEFEIAHEVDAPFDRVERAVVSPDLGAVLGEILAASAPKKIERVETMKHEARGGEIVRVLRFHAGAPLPFLEKLPIPKDAMTWEETSTYDLTAHASSWEVAPKPEYRRYFSSRGTYLLERTSDAKTRRTVRGELEVNVRVVGKMIERMALAEVRRTYDAEADTLRRLASI